MKTETKIYKNRHDSAIVVMEGACLGLHRRGETCVRSTIDGGFAVIRTTGLRLVKQFKDLLHARRYNYAIHGDSLGE